MTNLTKLYQLFLNIGQQSSFSLLQNKKIKLLNIYVLITIHFIVIMPIGDVITGIITPEIVWSYFVLFLFMILILFLNKQQKYYWASSIWLGIVLFAIFIFSVVLLPKSYVEYYYVFVPGIALTLFTKNTIPAIVTLFSLFLFFIPYYFIVVYPPSIVNKLDPFAVLGLFACVYLLVNYFKKINTENEKKLKELYLALQESKKNELANMQLKLLKGRMNPHFMFNTMNSIQNLVIKGKTKETYQYLSKFSSIIREHLKSTDKNQTSFHDEFLLLQQHLELEKLRLSNLGTFVLNKGNVSGTINIPSMVIQPFIDNAIFRMFHNTDESHFIQIDFHQTEALNCVIIDNGIGIKEAELLSKDNALTKASFLSENLQGIQEHLLLLKEIYKIDVHFKYTNENKNTKCVITIPYQNI